MTDQQLSAGGQDLRERAIARLKQKRDFGAHLFVYLVVNGFLLGIWALTDSGFFWPVFPMFLWGIGLVVNAWTSTGASRCRRTGSAGRWSRCDRATATAGWARRRAAQPGRGPTGISLEITEGPSANSAHARRKARIMPSFVTSPQERTHAISVAGRPYIWLLDQRWPVPTTRTAIAIGGSWAAFTVLFEFGLGHYVLGSSWSDLFANYNLAAGRIWVLVPGWMALGPAVLQWLRAIRS